MKNYTHLGNINYQDKNYTIKKSYHTHDKRNKSKFSRDEFISNKAYIEIIKESLIWGLFSFRNKGNVVITVNSYNNVPYHVLLKLNENNEIFIISVYRTPKRVIKEKIFIVPFIREKNRINLLYNSKYKIPYLTSKDKNEKIKEKTFKCTNEDHYFKAFVNNYGVKKI